MNKLMELRNCTIGYGKKIILNNMNISLYENDFLGIVGPNGVGKTTILKSLLGFIKPIKGNIIRDKQSFRLGYVPQRGYLDPLYPLTVLEVVLMGRYKLIKRKTSNIDISYAENALKYVGIHSLKSKLYRELSGGQQQRALIARALVIEPEILILDEPTNGMDIKSQKNILDLLKRLHSEKGISIILVTHLLNEILPYIKRVVLLKSNGYIQGTVKEIINKKNLSEFYASHIDVVKLEDKNFVIVR